MIAIQGPPASRAPRRAFHPEQKDSSESAKKNNTNQGEPLVKHYLQNACVIQKWRIMLQIQLAVLDK